MTQKAPEEYPCATCGMRKKAEAKPKSFIGWFWRMHTKICPGWKAYQKALAAQKDQ